MNSLWLYVRSGRFRKIAAAITTIAAVVGGIWKALDLKNDASDVMSRNCQIAFNSKNCNVKINSENTTLIIHNSVVTIPDGWMYTANNVLGNGGKKADFVVLISKKLSWKIGSALEVQYELQPASFKEHISDPQVQELINSFRRIVAVGASSCEFATDMRKQTEEDRAKKRANTLQSWIASDITSDAIIYTLSMGQHKSDKIDVKTGNCIVDDVESANQRKLVILGLSNVEHGFDLDPASLEPLIKNSLVSMEIFPFKLNDYSKFNLNPE